MNNSCPGCGAIYNVAAKDIGRKIKCKKCSSALLVTDKGLEEDDGRAPAPAPATGSKPAPAVVADDDDDYEDDKPIVKKKKDKDRESRYTGPRVNPLDAVGGIPTVLFGFGVFLVIVFTSLPIIGAAGTDRASARVDELKLEQAVEIKDLYKDKKAEPPAEKLKEINEKYEKKIVDAGLSAERTKIGNRRDVWIERYGLMFGFIFVSFGCIGYLRTEQPLVLRIVAAVILAVMMIVMFGTFGIHGCTGGKSPLG